MSETVNHREYFIDVARVLAFSSVVVGHKFSEDFLDISKNGNPNLAFISLLKPAFNGGGAGVVLFFLVSGYVITKALTRESFRQFVSSRFFRIYPSLWLALVVYWISQAQSFSTAPTLLSRISSASLFGDFFETPNQLNGVDWTLRVEILFYSCCAIWMLLRNQLYIFGYVAKKWQRRGLYVSVVLILSLLPIFPRNGFTGYVSIFSLVFLGGIWLALFDLKKVSSFEAIVVVLSSFGAHCYAIEQIRPDLFAFGAFSAYGYIVFFLLYLARDKMKINKIIITLSNLTYLVYLFHNWLLDKFFGWFQFLPINPDGRIPLPSRLTSLVIFIVVMWLIHVSYEKPILKFGKKHFSGITQKDN